MRNAKSIERSGSAAALLAALLQASVGGQEAPPTVVHGLYNWVHSPSRRRAHATTLTTATATTVRSHVTGPCADREASRIDLNLDLVTIVPERLRNV